MVLTAQETRERDQRDVQAHTPTRHKHAEVIHVFTVYFAPSKLACGKRGQTKRSECQVFSKKPTSQHLLRLADALLDPLLESSSVLSPLFLGDGERGGMVSRGGGGRRKKNTAASRLAGDSSFGSESMEMTLMRMVSTVWMGNHRSLAFS